MRRALLTLLTLAGLAQAALPAGVGSQGAVELRIDALDASQPARIQATVSVLDAAGRPVTDLPSGAFSATADGATLPVGGVASASSEGLGIAVTLTFDTSGSMRGVPLAQAKQAGKALVNELGPNDQVAVISFADTVQVVQGFTADRQALAGAIDALAVTGNTALYDAVARSFELARSVSSPRRAVVLLTDGEEFGGLSHVDRGGSLAAAGSSGVTLFAIGLGGQVDQQYLQDLTAAAHGQLQLAPGPDALQGLYQSIGTVLRHQYVLTMDGSALAAGSSGKLRIQVTYQGATAAAEAQFSLPAPAPAPAPTAAAPTAPLAQQPAPQPATSGGGIGLVPVLGGVIVAAVACVGGVALWRRRRRRAATEEEFVRRPAPGGSATSLFTEADLARPGPASAWLEVAAPGGGQTYALTDEPVLIGFTSDCAIRFEDGTAVRWERVRVWRREGRYMLHVLSRIGVVTVAGKPATWAILEDGDEIQMGPCALSFHDGPPAGETPA